MLKKLFLLVMAVSFALSSTVVSAQAPSDASNQEFSFQCEARDRSGDFLFPVIKNGELDSSSGAPLDKMTKCKTGSHPDMPQGVMYSSGSNCSGLAYAILDESLFQGKTGALVYVVDALGYHYIHYSCSLK